MRLDMEFDMASPESTEERRYCHVCGVDLLPRTTEHIIGVHVDCVARTQWQSQVLKGPGYNWRHKEVDPHGY